jgi:hypothetical protein
MPFSLYIWFLCCILCLLCFKDYNKYQFVAVTFSDEAVIKQTSLLLFPEHLTVADAKSAPVKQQNDDLVNRNSTEL